MFAAVAGVDVGSGSVGDVDWEIQSARRSSLEDPALGRLALHLPRTKERVRTRKRLRTANDLRTANLPPRGSIDL